LTYNTQKKQTKKQQEPQLLLR